MLALGALEAEQRFEVDQIKDLLCDYLTYQKNTCPNERNIAVINGYVKNCKYSQQLLRDLTTVVRYGPSHDELVTGTTVVRNGKEEVHLEATPRLQAVKKISIELRGRRHGANKKRRRDVGKTGVALKADGPVAVKRLRHAAVELIRKRPYEPNMVSVFGGVPLKELRVRKETMAKEWSPRFAEVAGKYQMWKQKNDGRVTQPVGTRFKKTAKQKQMARARTIARAQTATLMRSKVKESVTEEFVQAQVRILQECGDVAVKAPWTKTMLIEQADVLRVKNLSKVCNFRIGCGLLPNPVLLAILYGLRICTPKYLHTVSLNWTDIEDEEVSTRKLPISIKFEPISSYIAVNLFIEPSFTEKTLRLFRH